MSIFQQNLLWIDMFTLHTDGRQRDGGQRPFAIREKAVAAVVLNAGASCHVVVMHALRLAANAPDARKITRTKKRIRVTICISHEIEGTSFIALSQARA